MGQLIVFGEAVKAVADNKVGGYLVRFTSAKEKDYDGEYFTADTDFYSLEGARPILHSHGWTKAHKKRAIGEGILSKRDDGIWIDSVLNLKGQALKGVMKDVHDGKFCWSSGSADHMVDIANDGRILSWPIVEGSIARTTKDKKTKVLPLKAAMSEILTDRGERLQRLLDKLQVAENPDLDEIVLGGFGEALKAGRIKIGAMEHAKLTVLVDALKRTGDRLEKILADIEPMDAAASDIDNYGYMGGLEWRMEEWSRLINGPVAGLTLKAGRPLTDKGREQLTSCTTNLENAVTSLKAFLIGTDDDEAGADEPDAAGGSVSVKADAPPADSPRNDEVDEDGILATVRLKALGVSRRG